MDVKIKANRNSNFQSIYIGAELVGEIIKKTSGVWEAKSLDNSITHSDLKRKDCVEVFVRKYQDSR